MISKELLHERWFWIRAHPEELIFYTRYYSMQEGKDSDIIKTPQ